MTTHAGVTASIRHTPGWFLVRIGIGLAVVLLITFALLPSTRRIANPAGEKAAIGVNQIIVRGDAFQNHRYAPSVVRVPVGTTITWVFADRGLDGTGAPVAHNVVSDGFVSPALATGSFRHTFTQSGSYRYTCTLHIAMDGQIDVVAR